MGFDGAALPKRTNQYIQQMTKSYVGNYSPSQTQINHENMFIPSMFYLFQQPP